MSTGLIINAIIWLIVAGFVYLCAQKIVALLPIDAWFKQIIEVLIWILVAAIVLFKVLIPVLQAVAGISISVH